LSKLSKAQKTTISQLRQVASDESLDITDYALINMWLKQQTSLGANSDEISFVQTDSKSGMRSDAPFIVRPRRTGSK